MLLSNIQKIDMIIHIYNQSLNKYKSTISLSITGTWNQPNPIGSGGILAEGEQELENHIFYGIPNVKANHLERYKNRNVAVVGGGHSCYKCIIRFSRNST